MANDITIRNLLEIRPDNTILIPGAEPISSLTSNTLAANMAKSFDKDGTPLSFQGPVIPLDVALEKIPGSYVVFIENGGGALGTIRRFFVLPDGPPPSPANCDDGAPICRMDWYAIMRANAQAIKTEGSTSTPTVDQICDYFSLQPKKSGIL